MVSIFEKIINPRYLTQDPKRLLTFAYDSKKPNSLEKLNRLNKLRLIRKHRLSK
jgi:hypothetical protein